MKNRAFLTPLGTALLASTALLAGSPGCSASDDGAGSSSGTSGSGIDGGAPTDTDAGAGAGVDGGATTPPANVPGKYAETLDVDGVKRELVVYVPEKAKGTTPVPVVFMVHGTSGTGEEFYTRSLWKELADEQGIIAVFPTALTYCYWDDDDHSGTFEPKEKVVFTKWAAGKLGEPGRPLCTEAELAALPAEKRALADHPLRDDVKFFDAMLDHLGASYAVDAKRIYASGFSNGAEMTGRLAAERSNRFAAIGCAASGLTVDPPSLDAPVSVVFSVGENDPKMGDLMGAMPIPLTESLITTNTKFAVGFVKPYLTLGKLDQDYTYTAPTIAGAQTSQFYFQKSLVGRKNTFRAVIIQGAIHEYPNGTNHPIRMAYALWEFFKTESLP